jgi:hypothetical protein
MIRNAHQHTLGIDRRELLQIGYCGLPGFGLPTPTSSEPGMTRGM